MSAAKDGVLRLLREGRERVARDGGWTQGEYARDAHGRAMDASSGEPKCYCAVGAVLASRREAVNNRDEEAALWFLAQALPEGAPFHGVVHNWNDAAGRTQADVVALYDRAIAAVETRDV